ncbi:MAG: tetratricopeptide repeat protein [Bdellovibrionales bacterium]
MDTLNPQTRCTSCEELVPAHYKVKGITQCLTCMSLKVSLAEAIKPDQEEKTSSTICAICSTKISQDMMRSSVCEKCIQEISQNTGKGYEELYQNFFRPWLLRISTQLVGPLSTQEVEDKIHSKELGIFDSVQKPFGRWIYVREEPTFKNAVEEARRRIGGKDDTHTLAMESTAVIYDDEVTESSMGQARSVTNLPDIEDLPLEAKKYVTSAKIRQGLWKSFLTIILMIGVAAGVFAFLSLSKKPNFRAQNSSELLEKGLSQKNAAQFLEAKKTFQQILESNPQDAVAAVQLVSLYLVDQQTVEAERLLNEFQQIPTTHPEYISFQVLRGMRAIASGNAQLAEEEFKKALMKDQSSYLVHMNLAILYSIKGEHEKSYRQLHAHLQENQFDALATLIFSESAGRLSQKEKNKELVRAALTQIQKVLPTERQQRQSLILMKVWLESLAGDKALAEKSLDSFFENDFSTSDKLLPTFFLIDQNFKWSHFSTFCQEVSSQLGEKSRVAALQGVCRIKSDDLTVGREMLEDALSRNIRDTAVAGTLAWSYGRLGQPDKSRATLEAFKETPVGEMPLVMVLQKWKLCQQQGGDCAALEKKIETSKNVPLEYIDHSLNQKMKIMPFSELRQQVDMELATAPRYIPFHKLKNELTKSLK